MNASFLADYEALERRALELDDVDHALAEHYRGLLDFIWLNRLTQAERAALNARSPKEPGGFECAPHQTHGPPLDPLVVVSYCKGVDLPLR